MIGNATMQAAKEAFVRELNKNRLNLARLALSMAQYIDEPFDIQPYLQKLDELAKTAAPEVKHAKTLLEQIDTLNQHIFEQTGLRGNKANYYDPNNSFINKVLDTSRGIPISLSIIYLEVGQRLNLPVWGVGMPRHFIVGFGPAANPVYIDVFNRGRVLSVEDCMELAGFGLSDTTLFAEQYLQPVSKRDILFRMLTNLKQIYFGRHQWQAAYKTTDLMVSVRPRQIKELKDRGLLAYRLNWRRDAVFDLRRYLFLAPEEEDTGWLEKRVELIEEELLRLN